MDLINVDPKVEISLKILNLIDNAYTYEQDEKIIERDTNYPIKTIIAHAWYIWCLWYQQLFMHTYPWPRFSQVTGNPLYVAASVLYSLFSVVFSRSFTIVFFSISQGSFEEIEKGHTRSIHLESTSPSSWFSTTYIKHTLLMEYRKQNDVWISFINPKPWE